MCYSEGNNHQALKLMAKVIFLASQRCSCVQCLRQDLKASCLSPHCQGWGSAPPLPHRPALNNVPKKSPPRLVNAKQLLFPLEVQLKEHFSLGLF